MSKGQKKYYKYSHEDKFDNLHKNDKVLKKYNKRNMTHQADMVVVLHLSKFIF